LRLEREVDFCKLVMGNLLQDQLLS
jgi:hypothetical protein